MGYKNVTPSSLSCSMMPLSALRGLLLFYCLLLVTQRKLSEEIDMSSSDCDDDTRSRCQKVYRPITDNFFKLYQNPEYWPENTNVLFSPISLMAVVAIFSLGTKADTQAQIMKCLGLSRRELPMNLIQQCLQCLPYVQHQPDDELQLTASSHLFIGNNLKLKHRVLKNLKLYHAERTSTNFTDTKEAVQQLSKYAEKDTQREIMGFIKEHNKDANLVLLNYMNFHGKMVAALVRSNEWIGRHSPATRASAVLHNVACSISARPLQWATHKQWNIFHKQIIQDNDMLRTVSTIPLDLPESVSS